MLSGTSRVITADEVLSGSLKTAAAGRKETIMDALLNNYTQEQLLSELEKGNYWYFNGKFHSNPEQLLSERPVSVENAVYYRFYS
jgi:hypothetical protein